MQCPSCQNFRPANNAPCPLCNAPSPLVTEAWNGQNTSFPGSQNQVSWGGSNVQNQAAWGGPNDWGGSSADQMSFPPQQQFGGSGSFSQPNFGGSGSFAPSNFGGSGVQPGFGGSGIQQSFPQAADGSDNSFWSQNMASREARGQNQPQSLLPVPFQPSGFSNPNGQLATLPTAFPTIGPGVPQVNSLVPALPDTGQEAPVYVAPMYTKPRPIIPRYRAVSGLISFLLVMLLLCGGAGYYAQVTGKLVFIEKLFGSYTPTAHPNAQATLPVPSSQVIQGPASKIIYSVGISNTIDTQTGIIPVQVNKFTVGETIWLACSAKPTQNGELIVKWYSNNNLYQTTKPQALASTKNQQTTTVTVPIKYGLPAEGKAEVYWNDQLAATVLFVVEPAA